MFLCPGIDGSKLVNTHPQLNYHSHSIPRTKWSNARPPELRHREMLTTTDADSRDSGIVFPISVDMTNVQTPALF